MMSDLPRDLAEEVLSKLPLTSLRVVRSTCKNWNSLSKNRSFKKKHLAQEVTTREREFTVVMAMDGKVYLMSIDLYGIQKGIDPSINRQGKLVCLYDSDQVDISRVYHCDGLLLCITKDYTRFVVWNPYSCQTLWLKPRYPHPRPDWYTYAIGYDDSNSSRNYKVLRFVSSDENIGFLDLLECHIYELNSSSCKVVNVTCDWHIEFYARGVSLKGNTYWFAQTNRNTVNFGWIPDFLICFDFATERFGPHLPIPFQSLLLDTVSLSSVREEQLAVLFQGQVFFQMEIWVTTKIEPQEVLWSKFLAVDMQPLSEFQFSFLDGTFIIDEEKKLVVVFDKDNDIIQPTRNTAYIIGGDGYYKEVDLGESTNYFSPTVCSYVPSSAHVKRGGKRKKYNKREDRLKKQVFNNYQ